MAHRSTLVAVSTVQLAAGLVGQLVALRRKRAFDIPFLHGDPTHVGRDSLWGGTSLSAPVHMLAVQGWATRRLHTGPDDGARRALGALGLVMTAGYLLERLGRRRLTPGGFDPVETPVVLVGLVGATAMGVLGHRDQAGR